MSELKKTIWVDLLCISSLLRIFLLVRRESVERVYFANHAFYFSKHLPLLVKIIGRPMEQIVTMTAGVEHVKGRSVYEEIQERLTHILEQWVGQKSVQSFVEQLCSQHGYHPVKLKEHLKEAAYPHVFRMVELSVWADCKHGLGNSIFVFRRTPIADILDVFLDRGQVWHYRAWIGNRNVPRRSEYIYDSVLNKKYFSGRLEWIGPLLLEQIYLLISILFCWLSGFQQKKSDPAQAHIGVELIQSRFRMDEINDLYWLKDSFIDPRLVCGLEFENYDQPSSQEIKALGIKRCKVVRYPSHWFFMFKNRNTHRYVTLTFVHWLKNLECFLKSLPRMMLGGKQSWLEYQGALFHRGTFFWQAVYQKLSLRLLWSMYDIDPEKLAKAQALEKLDGFFMGSHWSNMPLYTVLNQKCYDVLLAWGAHFMGQNFNRYPFMAVFFIGYPCDYYFGAHETPARELRQPHKGKFIISYADNIMAADIPFSKGMQLEMHTMLISLLKKFEQIVIFLKPKRKFVWEEILAELPELNQFIQEGRLEVFLGETSRTKAVPARIGIASDLVIGLGISTAAAEAFFAGTVSFHADLTGFKRNEFANQGNGVIVFRDIFTLERAIIERIEGKKTVDYERYRSYYTTLDPFQDGCAAKRTGFVVKHIREYLQQGVDRPLVLEKVAKEYDVYLASLPNLQRIALN